MHIFLLICGVVVALQLHFVQSDCDLAKYEVWKEQQYFGQLASDSSFWIYQTQGKQIILTNYLASELALQQCKNQFDLLYYYLAGRMGPIDIQHSYKIMCRDVCLESDALHEAAMAASGCSCLELSTKESEPSYTREGDFCRHNTARLLCDIVGYCGVWECRIDDFMCPRYEWNKKLIPFKGIGSCARGAATTSTYLPVTLSLSIAVAVAMVVGFDFL